MNRIHSTSTAFATLAITVLLLANSSASAAQTVWDGPLVSFSKAAFADPTDSANQDSFTSGVSLTRGTTGGLYNTASESSFTSSSPAGTEWALGTTADLGSLSFATFKSIIGPSGISIGNLDPVNDFPIDFVVHLTAEDVYLDLSLEQWGAGTSAGGGFAYTRLSPSGVPEPGALVLVGIAGLAALRRRS